MGTSVRVCTDLKFSFRNSLHTLTSVLCTAHIHLSNSGNNRRVFVAVLERISCCKFNCAISCTLFPLFRFYTCSMFYCFLGFYPFTHFLNVIQFCLRAAHTCFDMHCVLNIIFVSQMYAYAFMNFCATVKGFTVYMSCCRRRTKMFREQYAVGQPGHCFGGILWRLADLAERHRGHPGRANPGFSHIFPVNTRDLFFRDEPNLHGTDPLHPRT